MFIDPISILHAPLSFMTSFFFFLTSVCPIFMFFLCVYGPLSLIRATCPCVGGMLFNEQEQLICGYTTE